MWRQCMLNATLLPPELCYKSVASSVTTALKSVPDEDEVSIVNHATHLASLAWDDPEVGMKFGDPRCMPNHIKMLKRLHPNMRYAKIDKKTGTCCLVCEVLWAQLFLEQSLMSSQYDIVRHCDTVDQAKSELMDLIMEARTELGIPAHWAKDTKHLPGFASVSPTGMMLLKEKSKEGEGLINVFLIVSHVHHPSSHEGSLVSPTLLDLRESVHDSITDMGGGDLGVHVYHVEFGLAPRRRVIGSQVTGMGETLFTLLHIPGLEVRRQLRERLNQQGQAPANPAPDFMVRYLQTCLGGGRPGLCRQRLLRKYTPASCPGLYGLRTVQKWAFPCRGLGS